MCATSRQLRDAPFFDLWRDTPNRKSPPASAVESRRSLLWSTASKTRKFIYRDLWGGRQILSIPLGALLTAFWCPSFTMRFVVHSFHRVLHWRCTNLTNKQQGQTSLPSTSSNRQLLTKRLIIACVRYCIHVAYANCYSMPSSIEYYDRPVCKSIRPMQT